MMAVSTDDMAEPLRTRLAHFLVGSTLVLLTWSLVHEPSADAAQGVPFTYKGKNYVMDPFTTLWRPWMSSRF